MSLELEGLGILLEYGLHLHTRNIVSMRPYEAVCNLTTHGLVDDNCSKDVARMNKPQRCVPLAGTGKDVIVYFITGAVSAHNFRT